jgi:hypothetical protein
MKGDSLGEIVYTHSCGSIRKGSERLLVDSGN